VRRESPGGTSRRPRAGVDSARRPDPSLVPLPLALPVSFRPRGIVLKQLRPVVRVLRPPLLRALQTPLPIHRIGGDLPSADPFSHGTAVSSTYYYHGLLGRQFPS
jgi:hypothetical protein